MRKLKWFAFGVVILGVVASFQNCSPGFSPGDSTSVSDSSSGSQSIPLNQDPAPAPAPAPAPQPPPAAMPVALQYKSCVYYRNQSVWPTNTLLIDTPYINDASGFPATGTWGPRVRCVDGSWYLDASVFNVDAYDICEFYAHISSAGMQTIGSVCLGSGAGGVPLSTNLQVGLAARPNQALAPAEITAAVASFGHVRFGGPECLAYSINWGDGQVENFPAAASCRNRELQNRKHIYTNPGTYTITLTISSGLSRTRTVQIY